MAEFLHKMYLYIKNGESERWLTVQLVDGHIPRVAGLSEEDALSVDNLEPAIWFKVMVLKSINIDCDKRVAHWTNGVLNQVDEPVTYWLSGDDTYYDWDDDVDELFNIASVLILSNPLAEPNERARKQKVADYERNLFRMLHCYILPKIQLHPSDLESVQTALEAQNKSITKLEDVVLMHSRLAEHYMNQMKNIRDKEVLPILEDLANRELITEDLQTALLYDILKAEPLLRREVDQAQKRVDHLKELMSLGAVSRKVAIDLNEARKDRDETHNSLVKLLVGKALSQSAVAIAKQVKHAKVELAESCVQYVRFYNRMRDEKKIVKDTMDKKVRATSVRECINSVISDLKKDQPAYGDDPEVRPSKPEWQTLSQRLTSIVHNDEHPVGLKFKHFTNSLQMNYRKIIRSAENVVYGSKRFMTSFNDFYVISEQDLGLNKLYLEDQRNIILGHLCQISELLAEHFNKRTQMFLRKIRLCYEKSFFNRVGRDLILVYRVVHGKAMQTLEGRLTALREVSLCKLGLQMKNEWWVELFEPTDDEESVCSFIEDEHSFNESLNEFGDNESSSDFDEEEYCSDNESETNKAPVYGHTGQEHDAMKKNLLLSKSKVVSTSLPDLTGIDLIHHQASELAKTFEDKSIAEFNTDRFGRYMAEESDDNRLRATLRKSLKKCHSLDLTQWDDEDGYRLEAFTSPKDDSSANDFREHTDTFEKHFGKALVSIKGIFMNSSPLKKMQCLTTALRQIACKVEELRMREYRNKDVDHAKIAVTAEDLLPLLVLVLLKMAPHDVAKLYTEILFISDLMADFLSAGCHSYALCEFQIAFRVMDQTCDELSL